MYYIIFFAQIVLVYLTSKKVTSAIYNKLNSVLNEQHVLSIFSLLFLPGTFLHEASHFLTAKILFVPVGNFNLKPDFEEDGIQMGSVSIGKTDPFRRFVIGIAPVLLGIIIVLYLSYLIGIYELFWQKIILAFLIFTSVNSMFSSRKDMEGAVKLIFTISLFVVLFYYLGIDIKIGISTQALSQLNEITKTAVEWLLIPLGLNFIFLLSSKIF